MNDSTPSIADAWAHEAARFPLAFSQVREDSRIDEAVLRNLHPGARGWMIASGGDTAAAIVASGLASRLELVDINPAQLALARLKLRMLRTSPPGERLALLGHRPMPPQARASALAAQLAAEGLPLAILGPSEDVARLGPDQAGRYERLFDRLRHGLRPRREEITELLQLSDPGEQARFLARTKLAGFLDRAFEEVMRLENLVRLFGEEATRNGRVPFAQHFAERTRHVLETLPAASNPYLAQMLLGAFASEIPYDWLQRPAPTVWPEIVHTHATALQSLAAAPENSVDWVHLSNILDWLAPEQAAETLALTWRALRPGGKTIVRQLNSTLDIPVAGPRFIWDKEAPAWHAADRSFFYRALFVGQKPSAS